MDTRLIADKKVCDPDVVLDVGHLFAITPTRITVFPYQALTELLRKHPALATKIFAAINQALAAKYLNMLRSS